MTQSADAIASEASDAGAMPRGASRAWGYAGGIIVVLALLSALATFLALAGMLPIPPTHQVVYSLFIANAFLILLLMGLVAREGLALVRARRAGIAAAGLHVRIVGRFAFVAVLPAVLVAALGWMTLERSLDAQSNQRVSELLTTSVEVAVAYRELQCRTVGPRDEPHGGRRRTRAFRSPAEP